MAIFSALQCFVMMLGLSTVLVFFMRKIKKEKHIKHLPPSPPKLPIIGNLHQLGALPHCSLWKLSQKHGPVMLLKLGAIPTVVVSSAPAAKEVLKVNDLQCCTRPTMAAPRRISYNYLDVVFSPYGDNWREMRKICVLELLNSKRVHSFSCIREEELSSMVDIISQASLSHIPVNLSEKLFFFSANATCRVVTGKSFQGNDLSYGAFKNFIQEAAALLQSFCASDFFPHVGWLVDRLTGFHDKLERAFHNFDAFYQQIIDQHVSAKRRNNDDEPEDVVGVLFKIVASQSDCDAVQITHDHVKAILMNIFLAGIDTTATTTVWAMVELIRNPRVMRKVQDEIRTWVGNRGRIVEEDMEKLSYLKMVVKETLRLHPAGPLLLAREAMSAFKIHAYDIPEKTRILVNVWGIGRDRCVWAFPEEFVPERFEDTDVDYKGQHFELLPFGSGRRGCPGIQMGVTMMELGLANLLYYFNWKLPHGMQDVDMEEGSGISLHKKKALNLVPLPWHCP